MLVGGVDVGNSTTELAVARLTPGAAPDFLGVWRTATTGAKGSTACSEGVSELVARAERRLGEPLHRLLLAELNPVDTGLVELGRLEELDLARNAVVRPVSETPSGAGAAGGNWTAPGVARRCSRSCWTRISRTRRQACAQRASAAIASQE